MRTTVLAALIALSLVSSVSAQTTSARTPSVPGVMTQPLLPPYVAAAINDSERQADKAIDARRKAGEVATFTQVKPGQKVLELIPGAGYFTRVFSAIVGAKGHVYVLWPNEYAKEDESDVLGSRKLVAQSHYANVVVLAQPAAQLSVPEPVDVVFTSQNYHDYPDPFMGKVDPAVLNKQVFAALKPGGVYVIVDHVAEAGSGLRDTDTLHRIDPAIVKKEVEAAGFVFDGESNALRNPADTHTAKVFDKAIRGHTDQFIYRFRKPAG
ncbi:class I SAM-dependent methyltransferase [Dyella tabacisoli]|uniref:Methyltransferase n=1 Tax=Dyella tabacisoli TaxID=2282381 RepID=A0A369UM01_9GAMM|nr:class I SAM-dependent methyltransferase [Dyella tabacisoli]RDD81782.1 methyltransferase [Dyella tabacisoli]